MAQADWTELANSLSTASVRRAPSAGFAPPPGGGSFVFGFNSLDLAAGTVGYFYNGDNFAPMAKGGSVTGCLKRGLSGGSTGFAPLLFICLQGADVFDKAYMLGIADGEPAHLVLRKAVLNTGLADVAPDPTVNGVLRRSTLTFSRDTWVHLRLDAIVNLNGDVRLQCFRSDLTTNPLSGAPNWQPVAGLEEFVDDALGVNSGSMPLTSGRLGWAFWTKDVARRAYVDHVQPSRQV